MPYRPASTIARSRIASSRSAAVVVTLRRADADSSSGSTSRRTAFRGSSFRAAFMFLNALRKGGSIWSDGVGPFDAFRKGIRAKIASGAWRSAARRRRRSAQPQRPPRTPDQLAAELAAPDVLAGPHGETVRRAAADRAMMLDIVDALRPVEREMIPGHSADGRRARAARRLGRDDAPSSRRRRLRRVARQRSTARIASLGTEPDTPERERRLSLLQRQRASLHELLERRQSLANQLESAGLMLQNLKLDLLKLRSSGVGSAIEDVDERDAGGARAVARDRPLRRGGGRSEEASLIRRRRQAGRRSKCAIASATCRGASSGVKWRAPGITSSVAPGIACCSRLSDPERESRGRSCPHTIAVGAAMRASCVAELARLVASSARGCGRRARRGPRDRERPQIEIDRVRGARRRRCSRATGRDAESRRAADGGRKRVTASEARAMRASIVGQRSKATLSTRQRRDTRCACRIASDCAMPPPMPWPTMHACSMRSSSSSCDDALGVGANVDGACERTVAATVAEQVDDDDAMPRRHERNDVAPEMARCRKAVQEHDGLTGAAGSGGVVVDARAGRDRGTHRACETRSRIGAEDAGACE